MGVSRDDTASLRRNPGMSPDWTIEGSVTMRIGLKYITPALAAGAAAVAIAAAPAAIADPAPVAQSAAVGPSIVQTAGHGGGGFHGGGGGGFHGGGFHGGYGGGRGGFYGYRGWGDGCWPWGWCR